MEGSIVGLGVYFDPCGVVGVLLVPAEDEAAGAEGGAWGNPIWREISSEHGRCRNEAYLGSTFT